MLGSASKIKAARSLRERLGRGGRPTWSHLCDAGGTAKTRAVWAFVSGVSVVSPYLELIEDYRM